MAVVRTRRTKPAAERREDLIRAAERLFVEKGVEETTIDDLTSGADISKGAFYLHFQSKADVVEALRDRFVQGVLQRVEAAVVLQASDDWNGKVTAWAQACALGYLDATRLHDTVFAAAPLPSRTGLTDNALVHHLADLLSEGRDHGAWSMSDPSFTAVFVFNALHAVASQDGVADSANGRRHVLAEIAIHLRRLLR